MMHMSYWFGINVGDFLFHGLSVTSTAGFISICFGVLSLAILFEALKVCLVSCRQRAAALALKAQSQTHSNESALLLDSCPNDILCESRFSKFAMIFGQLLLFTSHETISYLLMLIVMTYNGYFTIAITIGAGIGFFVFSPVLTEISRRRIGTLHSRAICAACPCKDKSKSEEEMHEETDRLQDINEDSIRGAGDSCHQGLCPASSVNVEVALVHTGHEEVC